MGRKGLQVKPHHNINELKSIRKSLKKSDEVFRLTAIILLKQEKSSALKISRKIGTNHESVRSWVHSYNKFGIESLKDGRANNQRGDTFKSTNFLNDLDNVLSQECFYGGLWTGKKLQRWIMENYNKNFVISTVYRWMHELNYSWKTSRPKHIKGNLEEQSKFKKNISA